MEGYDLEFEDTFDGADLDRDRWIPAHLPQWSSRARAAARYALRGGSLVLRIDEDQQPWCPEFDGGTKVSSLQTGVFSGPAGSAIGQHRFNPRAVVREPQEPARLYTPQLGYVEVRARAVADVRTMVACWMIGYEDAPERSGEICIFEIFGSHVGEHDVRVGMGIHPFGDPRLSDDFHQVPLAMDATQFHVYAAMWGRDRVEFQVDGSVVKVVEQSPAYPMQLMLGIYEFPSPPSPGTASAPATPYPKEFVVDYVRGFRPAGSAQP